MLFAPALAVVLQQTSAPIVFETPKNRGEAMQVMAVERTSSRYLCDGQYPSSSPDGKWVAFADTKWMPEDTVIPGLQTKLCLKSTAKGSKPPKTLATFTGPVTISMPVFSASGKSLCFEVAPQRPNLADRQAGVYVIPAEGGPARRLYRPAAGPAAMLWPTWTDQDKKLVLVDADQIVWVDANTAAVSRKPASWLIGDWSRESAIAMVRPCPSNPDLYAYTLRSKPGSAMLPRNSFVYLSSPGETPMPISNEGSSWHPRWEPSGRGILFYQVPPGRNLANLRRYDRENHSLSTLFDAGS